MKLLSLMNSQLAIRIPLKLQVCTLFSSLFLIFVVRILFGFLVMEKLSGGGGEVPVAAGDSVSGLNYYITLVRKTRLVN